MKNMAFIISSHNKHVLQPCNKNYKCNCRKKESCPLENKCLMPNIIYEAQIINNANDEHGKYFHLRKDVATSCEILNIKSI